MEALFLEVRRLAIEEASIPALRVSVLLLGILAAYAWLKRRPTLSLLLVASGGILGLTYWLVQIVTPLGLGTDAALTEQWAQAGVNSLADPKGAGFVWGTPAERSMVAMLASLGAPLPMVFRTPQITAFLCFGFLILLPRTLIRNPATAAFAASLAVGGGLWPGVSPYSSVVRQPALFLAASTTILILVPMAFRPRVRRWFHRSRFGVALFLIAAAVLNQAFQGGAEPQMASALFLAFASIALASPLRAMVRLLSPSPSAGRRLEALVLLGAFSGSGLFWWNPPKALSGFAEAREGGETLLKPLGWIAQNVPPGDVVLASPVYSAQIAALAGRRVLFPPATRGGGVPEPFRRARLDESSREGRPIVRLAEAFSVTHLFLGPGEAIPISPKTALAVEEPRLNLLLVYQDAEDFRVFRLAKK